MNHILFAVSMALSADATSEEMARLGKECIEKGRAECLIAVQSLSRLVQTCEEKKRRVETSQPNVIGTWILETCRTHDCTTKQAGFLAELAYSVRLVPSAVGLKLHMIKRDSPWYAAGFRATDTIVGFNTNVLSVSDLFRAILEGKALTVERAGTMLTLQLPPPV